VDKVKRFSKTLASKALRLLFCQASCYKIDCAPGKQVPERATWGIMEKRKLNIKMIGTGFIAQGALQRFFAR
jgi:hypothetical protein